MKIIDKHNNKIFNVPQGCKPSGAELNKVQALNDLALPKMPNYRIDVNTTNGNFDINNVMLIRRVSGNVFNQGGGGWEVIYKGPLNIDKTNIIVTPLY